MLKFMGALLLFVATVLVGAERYNKMCCHRQMLGSVISSLRIMEGVLRSTHAPLEECFFKTGGFFSQTATCIREGISPARAVEKTVMQCENLSKQDKDALKRFAVGLSAPDFEGQLLNIKALTDELSLRFAEAEQSIKSNGQLMLRGSFLVGAAIFILVL